MIAKASGVNQNIAVLNVVWMNGVYTMMKQMARDPKEPNGIILFDVVHKID